ncbi:MAG TPA: hypothetical protein ENG50_05315 [Candidatus Altiarchaeales archaeon]|nr:MAG: hypothetical protein DRO65_01315 [Candidatus Altiarchaeales archaeon]HDN83764.1 hypothetical protein [Candidatus Altiarchaeales archaeon]
MNNICIITDKTTAIGMELAGMKGINIAEKDNVLDVFEKLVHKFDIFLISSSLARVIEREIRFWQRRGKVIVEIPDKESSGEEFTSQIVREVIGVEIKI